MARNISSTLREHWKPGIVSWNRIEGRPRKGDFDRTLRAEVRDALWMLTRQWQFGEFRGEDAGSPVFARTQVQTTRLTRYKGQDEATSGMDSSIPLEARVEQQTAPLDLAERLQLGRYWLNLIRQSLNHGRLSKDFRADYIARYPITTPDADADHALVHAHSRVAQWFAATTGRSMDGDAFRTLVEAGGSAADGITVSEPSDQTELDAQRDLFLDRVGHRYQEPSGDEKNDWIPEQLEYSFACSAPKPDGGETVLTADGYPGGRLDWYSFNIDSEVGVLGAGEDHSSVVKEETLSFIPAPIQFPGMPNPRWWEFENGNVDFGNIDAHTTDTAKLLLTEFSLLYGNDWFLIPFRLATGSLALITGFEVTNNFGERTWIEAAGRGRDDDWQRWALYTLSVNGVDAADTRLFLPAATHKTQNGDKLEEVQFIRDEMANLVWGIESVVPLEIGRGTPGHKAALDVRHYFESITPKDIDDSALQDNDAQIRYLAQTSVPENWIPLIPVHVDGNTRKTQLQRSAMLRYLDGVSAADPIAGRTRIISAPPPPSYVHEEEVPRTGIRVRKAFRRCRWHGGRTSVWAGIDKRAGRGERSSGLRFDQIQAKRNPAKEDVESDDSDL